MNSFLHFARGEYGRKGRPKINPQYFHGPDEGLINYIKLNLPTYIYKLFTQFDYGKYEILSKKNRLQVFNISI